MAETPTSGYAGRHDHGMRRHRCWAAPLASAIAAILVTSSGTAYANTAPAGPFDPPVFWSKCGANMRWPGNVGVIRADLLPNGFLVWDVRDYVDDHGAWVADLFVGKRRIDHKVQTYNPHGRVNPVDLRSGYILHFVIQHTNPQGQMSFSDPGAGCIIP
jgi:hypothetical protein